MNDNEAKKQLMWEQLEIDKAFYRYKKELEKEMDKTEPLSEAQMLENVLEMRFRFLQHLESKKAELDHEHDLIDWHFNDYVKRRDIDRQYFENEQKVLETQKKNEFLRNLQTSVLELKQAITKRREDNRFTQEQMKLESQLKREEWRFQKELEFEFALKFRDAGLIDKNLTDEQIDELIKRFEEENE